MNLTASYQPRVAATWPAALRLSLEGGARGTRLSALQHSGPLYVQKPFYPEGKDYAHIYLLHPPGGIVSGDALAIEVAATNSAHVLLTTPGATRAYRARDQLALQRQAVRLTADANSSIEYFPMETIVHNGARLDLHTRVELGSDCTLAVWDIVCLGLPASDKPFACGSLQQKFDIVRAGKMAFVDRLIIDGENRVAAARCGLNGRAVSGFFLAGPFSADSAVSYLEHARLRIDKVGGNQQVAVTTVNTFCIARYLGDSAAQARRYFTELWSLARPMLLARDASLPRIWYT